MSSTGTAAAATILLRGVTGLVSGTVVVVATESVELFFESPRVIFITTGEATVSAALL